MIRVLMTPSEVLLVPGSVGSAELAILPVLLAKVNAVSTILLVVPGMIIVTFPVVITLLVMLVSPHHRRRT
jgi:hypothetical protein